MRTPSTRPLLSAWVAMWLALAVAASAALPVLAQAVQDAAPTPPADGELAVVVDVIDGDTIRVDRFGGGSERVRYIGIDTPESVTPDRPVEPWGPEASAANERLVADRLVLLERDVSETDRYDRLLRYVWVETSDGWVMANAELVARGLAEVRSYPPDTRHDAWLRQVQEEARAAGRGLHGPASEEPDEPSLLQRILDALLGGG